MSKRDARFSDFSDRLIGVDDRVVKVVVLEHPDLPGGPVELEALPPEIAPAFDAALEVAILEVHLPDEEHPRRVVVEADTFNALATERPMPDVLREIHPIEVVARRLAKRVRNGAGTTNYATPEHAGTPHRGRVTEAEATIVREHLDDVNTRLADAGFRQVDPTDPADAEKYGFTPPDSPQY